MITDRIHRLAFRLIFSALLFALAAYLLGFYAIQFLVSEAPSAGVLLVGMILGVALVGCVIEHDHRRRTRGLDVIGRSVSVPRSVGIPSATAIATKYRDSTWTTRTER